MEVRKPLFLTFNAIWLIKLYTCDFDKNKLWFIF